MSLNKFTLDIESSSAESTMDDATEDEASVNQIIEFSDSDSEEEKETTDTGGNKGGFEALEGNVTYVLFYFLILLKVIPYKTYR